MGESCSVAIAGIELTMLVHWFPKSGGLNMLGPGSGTIRQRGPVGIDVALMEEVCHFRDELEDSSPRCLGDRPLLAAIRSRYRTLSSFHSNSSTFMLPRFLP